MIYLIDLFAGAGGTTTGATRAKKNGQQLVKVVVCVNHNPVAIASHKLNHFDCKHIVEDVRLVNLAELILTVEEIRENDPEAVIVLWGSPDCTGHSRANGNKKKSRDKRSLANTMIRYIKLINPDYIPVENVMEFLEWGPLDKDGKPVKALKGTLYLKWKNRIESMDYRYDFRFLNAADFGGYTTRTRYFGMFAKEGLPLVFPIQTHSKEPGINLFGDTKRWRPVREVLDLNLIGKSVFSNSRIRSDRTFRRIYLGCLKYVPRMDKFLVKYQGTATTADLNLPAPTLTKKDRLAYLKVEFIDNQYGSKGRSIEDPCFTLIARMDKAPPELITTVIGKKRIQELKEILSQSSGYKAKLIEFMLQNGISDIKKRMLTIKELLRIQGFGDDYKLTGTIVQQKEFIGNSVHPIIPQRWFEALSVELDNYYLAKVS